MRRTTAVAALLAMGIGSYAAVSAAGRPDAARLEVLQDVPDDVAAELDTVWFRFEQAFAGRLTCVDDVSVELVGEVDGGDARYVTADGRIEILIPTTPARFRESMAHELAHHVERTCPAFASLRAELHPRLGGADVDWFVGDIWFDVPSERYAEHVVELVNGERVRHVDEIPIDDQALAAIAAWAAGR